MTGFLGGLGGWEGVGGFWFCVSGRCRTSWTLDLGPGFFLVLSSSHPFWRSRCPESVQCICAESTKGRLEALGVSRDFFKFQRPRTFI